MTSSFPGRVLLVNNRPGNTGIGAYTRDLHAAVRSMSVEADLRQWRGRLVEPLYQRVVRRLGPGAARRVLSAAEETARIGSLLAFSAATPAGFALYHITSPSLSIIARWRRPCVITVHDTIPFEQPRDGWDALIRRSMLDVQRAAAVIVPTRAVRDALLRAVPMAHTRVEVIPHGVDHNRFVPGDRAGARRALGLPVDRRIVLHVGSEEPRKRVDVLLEAVVRLRTTHPDVLLVRIGEQTGEMRRLARRMGAEDGVRWLGVRDDATVALAYRAADVTALPSETEGFGLPILEAMASGSVMVAGLSPATVEVSGDAALLVPPGDAGGLRNAIEAGLEPVRAEKLRARGVERAAGFRWEGTAQRTVEVYERALSGGWAR